MDKKRWSEREKMALVRRFEASGQTRGEFCRPLGLAPTTFDSWRQRARRQPRLLPVEVKGETRAGEPLVMVLGNGRRIEVGAGFDEAALARLLAAAER